MKAIRVHEFGAPEVMRVEEVADLKPGAGQVVVRVHAAGVNPVETYIRSGAYARKPSLPFTPGADAGGVVESVGDGVTRFKTGDRVYAAGSVSGTYAERALCNEAQVHPLPEAASFAQGAALGIPYGTAYRALVQLAKAQPGETVLVHGASGGVGIAAVQLARGLGMTIVGTAGTEKGKQLVRQQGADHVLDHTRPDYLEEMGRITGGRGADVILEMLANKNLAKDLTVLAQFGRIVVIGNRGTIEINPRDLMSRDGAIMAMLLMNASEQDMRKIHAGLVAGLRSGTLCPVIGQEVPLADAPRAHVAVMEPGAYGKVVLVP